MRRIIVLAIICTGASTWCHAQDSERLEQRFRQLDLNRDGKLTGNELRMPAIFERLDLDGDGEIGLDEARRAVAAGALQTNRPNRDEITPPADRKPEGRAEDSESAPDTPSVREAPEVLAPGRRHIGRYVPDLSFENLHGKSFQLSEFKDKDAILIAMTSTSCPLSQKYFPTLTNLARSLAQRNVQVILVNPVAADKIERMRTAQERLGDSAIYVFDRDATLARTLRATTTTDTMVLDASRTVVYQGAIDDQYGFGYALDTPRHTYLADALDAFLSGRPVTIAATEAPGCTLDLESPANTSTEEITYYGQISRLVARHCVECHRDGGVAPFALESYEDMVAHASMIREVVERGIMPPWFAAEPGPNEPSPWLNDRSLPAEDKHDLLAWIQGGRAAGDVNEAPQPHVYPDGWLIGKPDAVFEFPEPVEIKADGVMPYQNITIETHLPEDKWVQAIEIQPGDRAVVHHVIVSLRSAGPSGRGGVAADERQGFWGVYVPGNSTLIYPDGYAKLLPKGAKLRFQMHYTPNGTATTDQTRIGLVYAKQPPQYEVRVAGIADPRLRIPPHAENHREVATLPIPYDVEVLAFLPHMHLRGKAARYDVVSADGSTRTLLDVPRYDFNWQLLYRLAEPVSLRRGDRIEYSAWYDNSEHNPANPDPDVTVRWGPQTFHEMHLGYVEYVVPHDAEGEATGIGWRDRLRQRIREFTGN